MSFRTLILHSLHNGVVTENWATIKPLLEEKGHTDIIDTVKYVNNRYRIGKHDFLRLIGLEHDR